MYQQDNIFQSALNQLNGLHFGIDKTIKNEYEAFQYSWDRSKTMRSNAVLWTKLKKHDEAAESFKCFGNSCYTAKKYKEAEACYLIAMRFAEHKGVTYGKILSNLALLQYTKGNYHQCIELINMCEMTKYPKNNFPKLIIRKIRTLKKIGDDRTAIETCGQLRKLLSALKLSKSERKKFLDEANEVIKEVADKKIKKECDEELIVPEMEGNLTSKAEIRKGGVRGTIVRATENIKLGETILVEQLLLTSDAQICPNCYSPNIVPHSCESCMFIMYCSENCKKADAKTHKLHCTLYQTRAFSELAPFVFEPFVILTKGFTLNAFHDFKAFSKDLKTFVKTLSGCLIVVHHIMENKQILNTLIDKNIVSSGLGARKTACEIGKKLLELAVILKLNREPCEKVMNNKYSFFPQYMSFGHSCAPNTSKYVSGNKIVVKAAEDIETGQEITVAYGSWLYSNIHHSKRQEELQMYYGFKCQCRACQNLYFETELTGAIKCERCGFYIRFEPSGFAFCENCSSAKWLDSEMRKIANLLTIESHISDSRQKVVETIETFKELKINPSNNTVVLTHLALALDDIDQGNIENAMKNIVTSNALKGPFNKYIYCHHSIFRSLQTYLKTLHSSASRHRITEKISIETVEFIEKFLNAFESLVNLYYPKRQILEGIAEVCKYLLIIKQIYTSYGEADKLEWNIVDEDDVLRKTIQMPPY